MKWKKVKLIDICNPRQWKNLAMTNLTDQGYDVYGANGVIGKYTEYNHEFPVIAITCRGATCGTINITTPKSYITSNAMALDDLRPEVDLFFLCYSLRTRGFKDIISGSAQPQITRAGLEKISILLPPLETQICIATLLSQAEALIAQRKESIRLLDEYVKSVFLEMFGDPVRNEKGWPIHSFRNVCSKIGSGATPRGGKESYIQEGISLIRSLNIHNNEFVFKNLAFITEDQAYDLKNVTVEANDVLLNITGASVARCCVVPYSVLPARVNQHVSILRCIESACNPIFLNHLITTGSYQSFLLQKAKSNGATREALTKDQLEELLFPNPPIALQNKFAAIVTQTETLKSQYQQSLTELEHLFGSLSQRAFRGELDIEHLASYAEVIHEDLPQEIPEKKIDVVPFYENEDEILGYIEKDSFLSIIHDNYSEKIKDIIINETETPTHEVNSLYRETFAEVVHKIDDRLKMNKYQLWIMGLFNQRLQFWKENKAGLIPYQINIDIQAADIICNNNINSFNNYAAIHMPYLEFNASIVDFEHIQYRSAALEEALKLAYAKTYYVILSKPFEDLLITAAYRSLKSNNHLVGSNASPKKITGLPEATDEDNTEEDDDLAQVLPWASVSYEQIANWVKKQYLGFAFSSEMLMRYLLDNHLSELDYYSSEDLKKKPYLNETEDLKAFIFSAVSGENPFIRLRQFFFEANDENTTLNLKEEDAALLSSRLPRERSGIYFNIIDK